MNQRATIVVVAAAIAVAGAIAVAVAISTSDTYTPRPEAYELSGDGLHITVAFCGSTADTIATQTVREDDRSVVVSVRLRRNREAFQHGAVQKVTYTLGSALSSRIVRGDDGTVVPAGSQFLCPG